MAEPGCVFCRIVAGDEEAFVIGSSAGAVAFLDIAPLSRRHSRGGPTAPLPARRARRPDELHVVAPLVEETARLLVGRLGADGVNLFQSSGEAAGQEVPHFHVHLVPRWKGDGVLRNLVREPMPAEELDALHAQLVG